MNRTLFLLLLLPVMAFGVRDNDQEKKELGASSSFEESLTATTQKARQGKRFLWQVTRSSGATLLTPCYLEQLCCALKTKRDNCLPSQWPTGKLGLAKASAFRFNRPETMQALNDGRYRANDKLLDGLDRPVQLVSESDGSDSEGEETVEV